MALLTRLNRPVRPQEDSDFSFDSDEVESNSPSILDTGEGGEIITSDESVSDNDDMHEGYKDESEAEEPNVHHQLSKISFGTLAKAQAALPANNMPSRKRKRGSELSVEQEEKLRTLRERLREIKAKSSSKRAKPEDTYTPNRSTTLPHNKTDDSNSTSGSLDSESESDSNSPSSPRSKRSKHAPAVLSSNRAITRRREVIEVPKAKARDPRFNPLSGPINSDIANKYSFLNGYRASEMAELRTAINKAKDEEKEILKRKLRSMESQEQARQAREKQREIIREHRKKERELVKQGKTPFYLKKSEIKQRTLIDRFQNMKPSKVDRAIERRRKKVAAKERKKMPNARRSSDR